MGYFHEIIIKLLVYSDQVSQQSKSLFLALLDNFMEHKQESILDLLDNFMERKQESTVNWYLNLVIFHFSMSRASMPT